MSSSRPRRPRSPGWPATACPIWRSLPACSSADAPSSTTYARCSPSSASSRAPSSTASCPTYVKPQFDRIERPSREVPVIPAVQWRMRRRPCAADDGADAIEQLGVVFHERHDRRTLIRRRTSRRATPTSPSTAGGCTPSIVGWPPNRPPCAGSPRWWRAALNLCRYLARWPRRCADACPRTPPDCGASRPIARLPRGRRRRP